MKKKVTITKPFQADFNLLKQWRAVSSIFLCLVSIFSILVPLLSEVLRNHTFAANVIHFSNYLFFLCYYSTSIITEIFLYPSAARSRRMNFIDNSFGSKFLGKDSRNYFSNDGLSSGAYKMAVNCFENCYFTYNIGKGMFRNVLSKNIILSVIFLYVAFIGLKENKIGLPILQVFLSSLFITELIHYFNFISKLSNLLERFKLYFMGVAESKHKKDDLHYPILLLLDYESILAYNKAPLSDKVYKKINTKLSEEWEEIKQYYNI